MIIDIPIPIQLRKKLAFAIEMFYHSTPPIFLQPYH